MADLSATFVKVPADQIDSQIVSALRQIVEVLGIDRVGFGEIPGNGKLLITHSYEVPGVPPSPRVILDEQFPWYAGRIRQGDPVRLPRLPDDLPPEAVAERNYCAHFGIKSLLTIPTKVAESVVGGISFESFSSYRNWPDEWIGRLRLVGDIFSHTLARKRADEELRQAFSALSKSEQELRKQYAQLASIYHFAPVGFAFVDSQLRYVSVNDSLAEMNGQPAEAHLGRTVGQVLPPHLADTIEPIYRRVIETGQPVTEVVVTGITASRPEVERTWLVSRYPVADQDGRVLGVNTVAQEITERKLTDERFRLAVESTPNAVVMVSADGSIVMVNSQCEKFFGYCCEELIGQPVEILVPESSQEEHRGYRAGFFASPSVRPMGAGRELHGRRKNGSLFPVEIGLTPIQTGKELLVLSSIVDISARKQAEEAMRELAHASRLALAGELTASIAHEINQPLGAILSNADAAEMLLESTPTATAEVRQILSDIRRDDLRASEVIRRLRALLRKREMQNQPVNVNEFTSEVVSLIQTEARRRGIAVETDFAAELPLVQGDKVHLQQVLLNLLFNGMEAMADMPAKKRLTVRTTRNADASVEITVVDSGPGISTERLSRVFEPFFSTKKEGMGIGLSIARSLVESHGGRIGAENNSEGGASFRFSLPTTRDQAAGGSDRRANVV